MGPYQVEKLKGSGWAIKRPNSGAVLSIRATREAAEQHCAKENAHFAKRQIEAAAPDLLAALKSIDGYYTRLPVHVQSAIHTAIAKAEGHSPEASESEA